MTTSFLPAGPPDDVPYEPWEGEEEALAEAAAAGRRAAAWIRSLPTAPAPGPVASWLREDLPEAIEAATSSLNAHDRDHMAPGGVMVDGTGGLDAETRSKLLFVPCAVQDALWLTPDQQIRIVAVDSLITGAARLLAEDPGTAITTGELSRVWALLDHAIDRAQDQAAILAGLVARSRGRFTTEQFASRLERGGREYSEYLAAGRQAAIDALEYAVERGVDAVDDELPAVAADKGMPITPADLTEALRRVRDHSLVINDGSDVAETAYWVADRFWMNRWNDALDQPGEGEYNTAVYSRFALHEWMAPGHSSGNVPGLGYEARQVRGR
ncbi:hypothetical protein [Streptomyces anulatus]|uniref:hypothetical protein n=1 Tax=Streptomyces anulatus TaxID=1892 RepID=UPI001D17D66E|nr:hypothetical protein [Streptomyces anulatus]